MKVSEKKWIRFRIYFVAVFFLIGLGTILARGYQLQVLERDKLATIARAGYKGVIKLPPKRGIIYDREGHELAVSVEVGSIYARPNLVKEKSLAASQLSRILNIKKSKLKKKLNNKASFIWIKRKVSPEKVRQVKALGLVGVGSTKESRRYYPIREIGAHLIGFAGDDNQGLEGLEKKYDHVLRGPQYTLIQMRDALGRPFFVSGPESFSQGHDMHNLVLTIDKDIQYRAQQALKAAVKKARAKSGQCVIVDPNTGEVLAMAVVPIFNPNVFRKHKPYQWRNRAITDLYEPGSAIKAMLLGAALEENIVTPRTKFFCEEGEFEVVNHIIHDTKKYRHLTVSDIVVYSSNIGSVKIGLKMGYEKFAEYLHKFGFGNRSGIDLVGERRGFVRPPKKARTIDRATIYFGQGITATSLQLAMAMGAIANGGKLMRPYVVKAIKDQKGEIVKRNSPKVVRRVLSPKIAQKVGHILEGVVSDRGTAKLAAIKGYRVAGKTGTSQKVDPRTRRYSKWKYEAIFAGFVPVDDPKLVMVVVIDEPRGKRYGGLVAGPVFSEVGAWALSHLRVNPQLRLVKAKKAPEATDVEENKAAPKQEKLELAANLLPDFKGWNMRDVLREGRAMGLKVVLEGTGFAVNQIPRAGLPLEEVKTVKVRFSPPQ